MRVSTGLDHVSRESQRRRAAATFPKPSPTLIFTARRLADGLTTFLRLPL